MVSGFRFSNDLSAIRVWIVVNLTDFLTVVGCFILQCFIVGWKTFLVVQRHFRCFRRVLLVTSRVKLWIVLVLLGGSLLFVCFVTAGLAVLALLFLASGFLIDTLV